MFDGVTQQLAECVTRIRYDDLSQGMIEKVKLMLLDSLGCALAGHITDRARIALELVEEFGGNPQATIIGNHRASFALAAFANSELINALDYDYIGPLGGHVGPYVTPPCLTIAEREHASGKALILAIALANEIGGRAISSLAQHKVLKEQPPYYDESPRFSNSSAVFGGVAGASKLLGFDAQQLSSAFGIAGASTPVPAMMKWEYTRGPAIMAKYNCWTGWIAQLATVATLAAEKGFTGDTTILDGERGYWQIVGSPFFKAENLLEGLGRVWHVGEVEFKLLPTCYIFHTAIEAISKIIQEHSINPDDIEKISVKGDPLMQTPNRIGKQIKNFADTQFSSAYNFALAAYYGASPSPAWQMSSTFSDPRIERLMSKVVVESHPRFDEFATTRIKAGKIPVMWSSLVEIVANGETFTMEVSAPRGSRDNPVPGMELIDKFKRNASYSMIKRSKVQDTIEMIGCLEEIDDVNQLFALLTCMMRK